MTTAAQAGKTARPSASATKTPDGLAGGLGADLGSGLGAGLDDGFGNGTDGGTDADGGPTGPAGDGGAGGAGAAGGLYDDDGGAYGGTGAAGRVGVFAKSCSETGGRPEPAGPLTHPDETTQWARGKGAAVG